MKRLLLLGSCLLMVATSAFAQGGRITLSSDTNGAYCGIDDVPGLLPVYVVHQLIAGATASQFAAPTPGCFAAPYLSDTALYPVTIGNSQTGVSIGYGACVAGPIHVLTMNFFGQGLTGSCCFYNVVADPAASSGQIEVVDCGGSLVLANGGFGIINAGPQCECLTPATEASTWGKVKETYR